MSPAENLAWDEALLNQVEEDPSQEFLRFWEPRESFVVLGYANAWKQHVFPDRCAQKALPILRRCSGGGTIVQSPGCLNYSLILATEQRPELSAIQTTNQHIMETHRAALSQALGQPVQIAGHTDLTLDNRKFSGNAQRRRRRAVLFHGTFLTAIDVALVDQVLPIPAVQPGYRRHRSHADFLTTLPLPVAVLCERLRHAWQAELAPPPDLGPAVAQLCQAHYEQDSWNLRF